MSRSRLLAHAAVLAMVLALLGVVAPAQAQAQRPPRVDDVVDFETGDLSQWRGACSGCRDGGEAGVEVVRDPVRAGAHAGRYRSDGYRAESAADRLPLDQDTWLGWSLLIPEDFPDRGRGTVSQVAGYQPPCHTGANFHLKVADGEWGAWLRNMGRNTQDVYGLAPVREGQWSDVLLNARWTHTDNGYLKLYIDGELLLERSGPTMVNCDEGPYFKAGVYAGLPKGTTVFVDEYRMVADGSCADVAVDPAECPGGSPPPAVPSPGPTAEPEPTDPPDQAPGPEPTDPPDQDPEPEELDLRGLLERLVAELERFLATRDAPAGAGRA